jgi:hypothetical protein
MATSPEEQPPDIPNAADHEMVRRVGKGSYGEVWLARNVMGTYRAIKIIFRNRFEDARPFEREFLGIQKFEPISRTHSGLMMILHIGRNQPAGYFYYVMEVADDMETGQNIQPDTYRAKTLSRLIARPQRLPLKECFKIGLALTDALGHLHRQGLVHRDVKPSNIIFVNGTPKLADIGLVTTIDDQGSVVGTPGFLPHDRPGLPSADLYSLGKLLYVMSMGQQVEKFPELPTESDELTDLPAFLRLNEVLLKACDELSEKRFQSAEEMRQALEWAAGNDTREVEVDDLEGSKSSATEKVLQVVIVYRSRVQPDGRLLQLLFDALQQKGHEVFIDRHLTIGVEWAREIESKIRSADAVIVLLSAASIQSEMVSYEVEIAHEAAQQRGKPTLLPVRVAYPGALSEPLGRILDPLQHTVWQDPTDDERVIHQVLTALESPPMSKPAAARAKLEPIGGAVPLDSKFYIIRPVDEEFRTAIARRDSIVLVKGARQMGKTSLLARGLQQAREAGTEVILTDFQMLNAAHLESPEALYLTLGESIANQLDLNVQPAADWNPRSGPNINFQRFLRREVLDKISTPLAWGLDEVDRLFSCSFGSEVFGLFRSWHNARSLDPSGPWSRLTLAIAYATEAHLFITDVNQSPFNVGTRLHLEDFSFDQVADLNRRYASPLRNNAELERFVRLVGGHPYLVRRGLHELVSRGINVGNLTSQVDRDEGIFGDHLRRILVLLAKNQELLEALRALLQQDKCLDSESFYRLRTAGIVAGDSAEQARPRCQLYENYLKRHLL